MKKKVKFMNGLYIERVVVGLVRVYGTGLWVGVVRTVYLLGLIVR